MFFYVLVVNSTYYHLKVVRRRRDYPANDLRVRQSTFFLSREKVENTKKYYSMIAAKLKVNANGAHTFLDVGFLSKFCLSVCQYFWPRVLKIVKVRFGTAAHILFTFYGILCNLIVCGSLLCKGAPLFEGMKSMQYSDRISLVGGAAIVNAITGMDIDAACFLIPIGIAVCRPYF